MKILKITGSALLAILLFAFIYANVRTLSLSENLERVNLLTYPLDVKLSIAESMDLEKRISTTPGVTACTVSKEGDKISMMFHPRMISEKDLTVKFSEYKLKIASPVVYAEAGACPVHQVTGSIDRLIVFLDLRN